MVGMSEMCALRIAPEVRAISKLIHHPKAMLSLDYFSFLRPPILLDWRIVRTL